MSSTNLKNIKATVFFSQYSYNIIYTAFENQIEQ